MSENDPVQELKEEVDELARKYQVRPDEMVSLLILKNLVSLSNCVHEHLSIIQEQGGKSVPRQRINKAQRN